MAMAWLNFLRTPPSPDARGHAPAPRVPLVPASVALAPEGAPTCQPATLQGADHLLLPTLLGIDGLDMAPMTIHERQILDHLDGLRASAAANLPRLPVVLPQLMRLVRRGDVGPRAIADCVARDPALVGEVMRLANSGHPSDKPQIADLSQAVALLGERGLTQLVTRVALQPVFSGGRGRASAACGTRLWALAERVAVGCGAVCAAEGPVAVDPFQAYLAGLVAHAGAIVALRQFDAGEPPRPFPTGDAFYRELHAAMAHLSGQIARQWQFPEPVCRAAEQLASPAHDAESALTAALRVAIRVAQRQLLSSAPSDSAPLAFSDAERRCFAALEREFAS